MTVYFLSCIPAALKLNGLYIGTIDGFERHIELDPADRIMAEIVPADNMQPLNFFIDEKFFRQPPAFADVYLTEGDALIYVREYAAKDTGINVIFQTRFCGNLVTVFSQGAVYLSVEGAEYLLEKLPQCFSSVRAEERILCGRQVFAVFGGDMLLILSEQGKIIFLNRVELAEFSDRLSVTAAFETCTAAKANCEYSYDGKKLTLISGKTYETRPPEREVIHFAFFESVLTCGSFEKYLDGELAPKAPDLKGYLGEFVSVSVPPEKFFIKHGEIPAAGLVYAKSKNLYEIKYFAVNFNGEKISNIYPVE